MQQNTLVLINWNGLSQFLREALTVRMLLVAALFFSILSGAFYIQRAVSGGLPCARNDSMLVYPVYAKNGVIIGEESRCGIPHRMCVSRGTDHLIPTYDCSPFMAPKGTFSRK